MSPEIESGLRLLLAAVLGAVIGLQRGGGHSYATGIDDSPGQGMIKLREGGRT